MSEAVENDTLESTPAESLIGETEPTLSEGEYFLTESIKGSGDTPEWYKADKYKSVADQAKAYTDLEKKFGGFTGAPKEGYAMPEGVDQGDELMQVLQGFAEETNMNQGSFEKAWDLLLAQSDAVEEVSVETEMAKLGDTTTAENRIIHVDQFMRNNMESEVYDKHRGTVTTAAVIELIEDLIGATAPAKLPIDGHIEPGGLTWSDIEAEMFRKDDNGNLLRSVDRSHESKIQRMMKEFGGDKPYSQTYG